MLNTHQKYGVTLRHIRCSRWVKRRTRYLVCIAHFFFSAGIQILCKRLEECISDKGSSGQAGKQGERNNLEGDYFFSDDDISIFLLGWICGIAG